jgi:hypothetical protein
MAFARLFPIDAADAQEDDRTSFETKFLGWHAKWLKRAADAVATSRAGHRSCGSPAPTKSLRRLVPFGAGDAQSLLKELDIV